MYLLTSFYECLKSVSTPIVSIFIFFESLLTPLYHWTRWNMLKIIFLFARCLDHCLVKRLLQSTIYSKNHLIFWISYWNTVQPTSVLTKACVWYEIRGLLAKMNNVKSHAMTLAFSLWTDMNQIFQMMYCTLL